MVAFRRLAMTTLCLTIIAACSSGGGGGGGGGPTPTPTPTPSLPPMLYAVHGAPAPSSVFAYSIADNGSLFEEERLDASKSAVYGGDQQSLALNVANGTLYQSGAGKLARFSVETATGLLTAETPYWPTDLSYPGESFGLAVRPAGDFAYVALRGSSNVFGIDLVTGLAIPGSPFDGAGVLKTSAALVRGDQYLFVGGGDYVGLDAYHIEANGALTLLAGSPFAIPGGAGTAYALRTDPTGNHLYVGDYANRVIALDIASDGTPTAIAGSPFSGGTQVTSLAFTPDGHHIYAGSFDTGVIAAWNVNPSSGVLTPIAVTATSGVSSTMGGSGAAITVSGDGKWLYALDRIGDIYGFSLSSSGVPSRLSAFPTVSQSFYYTPYWTSMIATP